ncbi:succinate dehydrogenase/fumarate reductase cytochrome b subunit, partial [Oceanidesulfovibrio marinus]
MASTGMDSAVPAKVWSRTAAYMDWAQMLTGAILILFLWSHMILVSSGIIEPGAMNAHDVFVERTGLEPVGGPIMGVLFLFHFVHAARKVPFRLDLQTVFIKHSRMLHQGDTWLWVIQAVSAMIILIMGAAHM